MSDPFEQWDFRKRQRITQAEWEQESFEPMTLTDIIGLFFAVVIVVGFWAAVIIGANYAL